MGNCIATPVADSSAPVVQQPKGSVKAGASKSASSVAAAAGAASGPPPAASTAAPDAARTRQMHKRIAVAAEAITSATNIEIPSVPKTDYAQKLIEKAIVGNLLFESLSLPAKQAIVRSMTPLPVKAGDTVISQGDPDASRFYVVERGACEVWVRPPDGGEERLVATCDPGRGFGELGLLYSAPRAATVRAAADGRLWVMERRVYAAIKRSHQEAIAREKEALLGGVPLLAVLAPEHKAVVAEALEMVEFKAGEVVFRQGDAGDKFYVVREGTVVVARDGAEVARLAEGAFFGERALINDEPRGATVTAEGYVVCFALGRAAFNEALGPIEGAWRYEALRQVPALLSLSEPQLLKLAAAMTAVAFAPGDVVFRQGDPGHAFYVVEEGTFSVTAAGEEGGGAKELAQCGKGQCFGELALLRKEPRAATVTAVTAARALTCTRDAFNTHLGSLADIRNLWRYEALRKVPLLASLTAKQRLKLCAAFVPRTIAPGAAVVTKGEAGEAFFVVERGACVALGDEGVVLAELGPGSYFGERALLTREPRAATVAAGPGGASLLELSRPDFDSLLGPLNKLLAAQAAAYVTPTPRLAAPPRPEDLQQVAVLGAGAFGRVTLVKYQGRYYALKALSKAHVLSTGLQEHIKREKALMGELSCPFLVNLLAGFQDSHSLYMLMEVVQGGEFFTYLQAKEAPLGEGEARFYAGCVVLALEYMHDRGVAWRDLKPENLLLEASGYLKITDFGFAKRLPPGTKSYTLCGTPEYLAPELVTQSGHGRAVDWWAVGVLVYEMVAGYPPFQQEDRVAMFRAICSAQFTWPSHFSKDLRDLIKRFLVRAPARRLGCMQGGVAEVKQHPWFKGFDWDALAARKMKPPYVPKVSGAEDVSNFEAPSSNPAKRNSRYVSTGVFADF